MKYGNQIWTEALAAAYAKKADENAARIAWRDSVNPVIKAFADMYKAAGEAMIVTAYYDTMTLEVMRDDGTAEVRKTYTVKIDETCRAAGMDCVCLVGDGGYQDGAERVLEKLAQQMAETQVNALP